MSSYDQQLISWKYLEGANGHSAGFEASAFNDSGWASGAQPFGKNDQGGTQPIATPWVGANNELCLRAHLNLGADVTAVTLIFHVDYSGNVYVNGTLVGSGNYTTSATDGIVPGVTIVLSSWLVGDNVIAVRAGADATQHRMELQAIVVPDPCAAPLEFDVYSLGTATTPALTYLATLCDAFGKSFRVEKDGTGSGKFSINRSSADATAAILGDGNGAVRFVKVRIPAMWGTTAHHGFFIEDGDFRLLDSDEDGGETLTFSGHGSLAYLDFAAMLAHSYITNGMDPFGGLWRLYLAGTGSKPGQMLNRVITEAQDSDRPQKPLPLLTDTFDYTNDSAAVAWASSSATAEFAAQIGESVLSVIGRLIGTGAITVQMSPNFVLSAYNSYGTNRSSATFAAGKVRFTGGVNIAEGLSRQVRPSRVATHALVYGEEEKSVVAALADAASRVTREAFLSAAGTGTTALTAIGAAELAERKLRSESITIRIALGADDAAGLYLPGPAGSTAGKFWVGDTVTLHTGAGEFDFANQSIVIAAINIVEGDAVAAVTDLEVTVELGSTALPTSAGSASGGAVGLTPAAGSGILSSSPGSGSSIVPVHTHPTASLTVSSWKEPVRAASVGNITIASPGATIDGITMALQDRFLAKDQSTGSQNGIYVWLGAAAAASRAPDFASGTAALGATVHVMEGTVNADTVWVCTTNAAITLDSTALTFVLIDAADHDFDGAVISPAQLTANTDNWNPTGLTTAEVIRVFTDASRNLTGIVAPAPARAIVLANVGAFDLVLKHDVTSTAANRFYCPNDTDLTLQKDATALLVYDLTSTRWRVVGGGGGGGSSFATPAIVLGSSAAAGAAATVIRSDSTIAAFDATAPVTQAFGDAAAVGSAAFAARRDHKHGMPPGGGALLASITAASAAIANTETVVVAATLAATTLTVGKSFRIRAAGVGTTGLTPGADTFRIRIGPTTLTGTIPTSVAPAANASVTGQPFSFEALVTVRAITAAGTIIGECQAFGDDAAAGLFTVLVDLSPTTATVAVNSTVANLLELTFQSGAAGSSCTFHVATIEDLTAGGGGGGGGGGTIVYDTSIPRMTSATAPSGVASDSEHYTTFAAWQAMATPGIYNGWLTNGSALPQWIGYQYSAAKTAVAYGFRPWWVDNYPSRTPKTWQFQGSNDGSAWSDLDSVSNWVPNSSSTDFVWSIATPVSYAYYRLYITANGGNAYTGVGEFLIFTSEDPIAAGTFIRRNDGALGVAT